LTSRTLVLAGAGLAAVVAIAIVAIVESTGGHSAAASTSSTVPVSEPTFVPLGSLITSHGDTGKDESGRVRIEAKYGSGGWKTVGTGFMRHGSYSIEYNMNRSGVARVRFKLRGRTFAIATLMVD
jgi:hypothetical protein